MDSKPSQRWSALVTGLLALAGTAGAYGAAEMHGSLMTTSDYFWRGYSKSDHHVSAQVNLDYADVDDEAGYYLGAWLSSVDFGEAGGSTARREMVLYGGWSQILDQDYTLDLQLSHYVYDARLFRRDADYSELYTLLHFRDLWTLELAYAPNAYASGADTLNSQLSFRYPLHRYLDFSVGVGYFAARDVFGYDYGYGTLGLTWRSRYFSLDVRQFSAHQARRQSDFTNYPGTGYYRAGYARLPFRSSASVLTLTTGF